MNSKIKPQKLQLEASFGGFKHYKGFKNVRLQMLHIPVGDEAWRRQVKPLEAKHTAPTGAS